jgi:glucokinase
MRDLPVLALDVGGSSVKSALVAAGPQIVGNICVDAIRSGETAAEILHTLAMTIHGHLEKAREVRRIAFAFPGPFDYERGVCLIQNQAKYEALYGLNVGAALRERLGMPTLEMRYRNDAEAAILGEALYGAGSPYSRLLGVTLGTGLGSAFVVDGSVCVDGDDVPPQGWLYSQPYAGQRADDVFSTRGLLARLRAHEIRAADVASAIEAADEGDPGLAECFTYFGEDLGRFLEPFVSNFRAEAVLTLGGIAGAWDHFAPSLRRFLSVPVLRGALGERGALFGAAALYS